MAENKFLTSVANVKLYDNVTGELILNGKTMLDTSLSQSIQTQAVNAGKGSQKIFEFNYGKELSVSISDAAFNLTFIALQNNAKVTRALSEYHTSEFVVLDAQGKGTLEHTPVGSVNVENVNGTFTQVTPVVKEITYPALANQEVEVSYAYLTLMDNVVISAKEFPKAVKMVMNADIMTNNGLAEEMQITVFNFKPDGAMELSLTHDGVANTPLAGTALANNKGEYAHISFKEVDNSTISYIDLAASPQTVVLEASVANDSETLTVYGVRGGIYGIALVDNSEVTFASDDTAVATVDATGKITKAAGATGGDSTLIRLSIGSAEDIVEVEIV